MVLEAGSRGLTGHGVCGVLIGPNHTNYQAPAYLYPCERPAGPVVDPQHRWAPAGALRALPGGLGICLKLEALRSEFPWSRSRPGLSLCPRAPGAHVGSPLSGQWRERLAYIRGMEGAVVMRPMLQPQWPHPRACVQLVKGPLPPEAGAAPESGPESFLPHSINKIYPQPYSGGGTIRMPVQLWFVNGRQLARWVSWRPMGPHRPSASVSPPPARRVATRFLQRVRTCPPRPHPSTPSHRGPHICLCLYLLVSVSFSLFPPSVSDSLVLSCVPALPDSQRTPLLAQVSLPQGHPSGRSPPGVSISGSFLSCAGLGLHRKGALDSHPAGAPARPAQRPSAQQTSPPRESVPVQLERPL